MIGWYKVMAVAIAAAAFFIGGYRYAAALYEADIAQLLKEHALTIKEKTDEYRAKEQEQAKKLAEAWDELEDARAESVDLRADVERVRKLADSYRAKLSGTSSDSCDAFRERLAGCTKLLQEGAELSAEGSRLSVEIATKKDLITKIVTFQ